MVVFFIHVKERDICCLFSLFVYCSVQKCMLRLRNQKMIFIYNYMFTAVLVTILCHATLSTNDKAFTYFFQLYSVWPCFVWHIKMTFPSLKQSFKTLSCTDNEYLDCFLCDLLIQRPSDSFQTNALIGR